MLWAAVGYSRPQALWLLIADESRAKFYRLYLT